MYGKETFSVSRWLAEIGLKQYVSKFRKNDISTLELLRSLTDSDLAEIGVQSLGHRKRILAAIDDLRTHRQTGQSRDNGIIGKTESPSPAMAKSLVKKPRRFRILKILLVLIALGVVAAIVIELERKSRIGSYSGGSSVSPSPSPSPGRPTTCYCGTDPSGNRRSFPQTCSPSQRCFGGAPYSCCR